MNPSNKQLNSRDIIKFNSLLAKLNRQDHKRDMIASFTGGRTSHTHDMTSTELREMLTYLQCEVDKQFYGHQKSVDKQRRKIFHYCHLMLWYKDGTTQLDYTAIDEFCRARGHKHKPLNDYTLDELPTLVSQFQQVYLHYMTKP